MIIFDCILLPAPSSPGEVLNNIESVADNTHPDTFEYKEVSPFRFIYYYLCINCIPWENFSRLIKNH